MARFDDEKDTELQGVLVGNGSAKAYHFMADNWKDPDWIPRSQADWIPDPDRTDGGGTMMIRAWLARKNDWSEL
jgi:hypothetical protein